MQLRSRFKDFIASVFTITSVVVFTFALFYALHVSPVSGGDQDNDPKEALQAAIAAVVKPEEEKPKKQEAKNPSIPKSYPAKLSIPSISVNAKVQHVGVTRGGDMAVPSNYSDVGWFKRGTVPGNIGTAVIDGHFDNSLGLPAVFGRLSELRAGDTIKITTHGGKTLTFKVTKIDMYDYDDPKASDEIFTDSAKATIKLITCDGAWLTSANMYSKRLVVTAELV